LAPQPLPALAYSGFLTPAAVTRRLTSPTFPDVNVCLCACCMAPRLWL